MESEASKVNPYVEVETFLDKPGNISRLSNRDRFPNFTQGVEKVLGRFDRKQVTQLACSTLDDLGKEGEKWTPERRDAGLSLLQLIVKVKSTEATEGESIFDNQILLRGYTDAVQKLGEEADPYGSIEGLLKAAGVIFPVIGSEFDATIIAESAWSGIIERFTGDDFVYVKKLKNDVLWNIAISRAGLENTDETPQENLRRMIKIIPDVLKLPTEAQYKVSGLFQEYCSHERLIHFVEDPAYEYEDSTVEQQTEERRAFLQKFYTTGDYPAGSLIAPKRREYDEGKGLRSEAARIDVHLQATDRIFFYLGIEEQLLDRTILPAGVEGFMAVVLRPDAKFHQQLLAFNTEDTANFDADAGDVGKLTLDISTLNILREVLLSKLGVRGNFQPIYPQGKVLPSIYQSGAEDVFNVREASIQEVVTPDFIDAIVVPDEATKAIFAEFGDIEVSGRKLKDIIHTSDEYQMTHKDRFDRAEQLKREITELLKPLDNSTT